MYPPHHNCIPSLAVKPREPRNWKEEKAKEAIPLTKGGREEKIGRPDSAGSSRVWKPRQDTQKRTIAEGGHHTRECGRHILIVHSGGVNIVFMLPHTIYY